MKILVVEDSAPLARAAKLKLEKCGAEVKSAATVAQAKTFFEDGMVFDAVWLDHYLLGDESGLELVDYMNEKAIATPVFLISNTVTEEKVGEYKGRGILQYFLKSNHPIAEIAKEIVEKVSK